MVENIWIIDLILNIIMAHSIFLTNIVYKK